MSIELSRICTSPDSFDKIYVPADMEGALPTWPRGTSHQVIFDPHTHTHIYMYSLKTS